MELPEALFRQAKAAAAVKGISLRDLMTQALTDKLQAEGRAAKPWLASFGQLSSLREETAKINAVIEREFGGIEPEDRL